MFGLDMAQFNDIATLAALVAACVGVLKGLATGTPYEALAGRLAPLVAVLVAAVFVLVPAEIREKIIVISVVSLTASGAYTFTKKRTDVPGPSTSENEKGGGTNGGGSNDTR
ncbi:hypothetical protein [Paenibacillus elgii]|uniref:hypothetical protein n=1 Tax=Paenibacillus elgii TaxID=189691 RepID=UPI000248CEF5|nr:hypothetical protein [Paenibacillus elgii]